MKKAIRRCKNCYVYLSGRGRPSATGDYFCTQPHCQDRRDRERARAARAAERAELCSWPTCVICGDDVDARGRVSFDGRRYCKSIECRYERERARERHNREGAPKVVVQL